MKRYTKRWLAFALAAALAVGDCIPAMAAAPTEMMTETELAEEETGSAAEPEEGAEPAEELPEEEPEQEPREEEETGQQDPEVTEGEGTAEPVQALADAADEQESLTVEEGTSFFMEEETKMVSMQVKETGYYSIQSSIFNFYKSGEVTCVTDNCRVKDVPGKPREGEKDYPKAYYLEAGKQYSLDLSSQYPGEESVTFHRTELPEFTTLTIGMDISVEANQWKFLKMGMQKNDSFYLGVSDSSVTNKISAGRGMSRDGGIIEAGEQYWQKFTVMEEPEDCYLVLDPNNTEYVVNCRSKVEIPAEDTKVLKGWYDMITVPAGQKKTLIYSPQSVGTYSMSYRKSDGVSFSMTDTGKGKALNWEEGDSFLCSSYSYGFRESEEESFGVITAVIDNQSKFEVTVSLSTIRYRETQELDVGEQADISDTAGRPYYFRFRAPEDGFYQVQGAETLWMHRDGDMWDASEKVGLETGAVPMNQDDMLYFAVYGKAGGAIQVEKVSSRLAKLDQPLDGGYYRFTSPYYGSYICTGDIPVKYYDFNTERWKEWQDGECMNLALACYLWSDTGSGEKSKIQNRDSDKNWNQAKKLTAGKAYEVAAKEGIQYFAFTAPATDIYYVTATEGMKSCRVYERYSSSNLEADGIQMTKGAQLWIQVVNEEEPGFLTVERGNAKQVSGEQFRAEASQNYIGFTPSLPGTYYYTFASEEAEGSLEYLTTDDGMSYFWKTWEEGTGLELISTLQYFRNQSGSPVRVYYTEKEPTALKVMPESADLTLPYDKNTGNWKEVTSSAAVTGVITDEAGNTIREIPVNAENVSWRLITPSGKTEDLDDLSEFTVTEPGSYVLKARYWKSDDSAAEGSAEITVTTGKKPYPDLQPVAVSFASNVDKNLTLGQIRERLEAETQADLSTGHLVITDGKGKVLSEKTRLAKGVNKWIAHYYLNEENPEYLDETTAEVEIVYGDLKLKKLESSNGTTIEQQTVSSTAYENYTNVRPVYTLNGTEISEKDLAALGYEQNRELSWKKGGILSAVEDSEEEDGCRVVGDKSGKDTLIWKTRLTGRLTGSTAVLSSSLDMKAVGEEAAAVKEIRLGMSDMQVLAEDVKDVRQEYDLTWECTDFSGKNTDAAIIWTTSDKSTAYVTKAKDGSMKLIIPKGMKGGTARITATAKDYHKASASFTVQVIDDDFRLDTTKLTLNSNSTGFGYIGLYMNDSYLQKKMAVEPEVEVRAVKKNGETDERFRFETEEEPEENGAVKVESILEEGRLGVQFREPQKAGTTTMILELRLRNKTDIDITKNVSITVTNKPAVPQTRIKVTRGYNPFWNGSEAYAKVLLTTAEAVQEENIQIAENSGYQIVSLENVDEENGLIWEVTLQAENPEKIKTGTAAFRVVYSPDWYRNYVVTVNAKIPVKSSTPASAVYGDCTWDAFWFPELEGPNADVLVELPEGMDAEEITDVALTAASLKNFEISSWEAIDEEDEGPAYVKKNGEYIELNAALRVHLVSKTGKSGNVQFILSSDSFSKPVLSKTKAVTAKKLSGEKAVIYDTVTGKSTSAYTLQKLRAGKEAIRVSVYDRNLENYNTEVKVEGGDSISASLLSAGLIRTEKGAYLNDTYLIQAAEDAFLWGAKSCKLKFTVSIENEETGESYSLKPVMLTINLKTQKTLPAMKATVKTVGKLDAANREQEAELRISFQNLPQGAVLTRVQLAGESAGLPYGLESEFWDNTVLLGLEEEGNLPIGRNKVELLCTVRQADGSCVQIPAAATVTVEQKAAVKASQQAVTFYSVLESAEYQKRIPVTAENVGENELEYIGVQGPEGKGIDTWYDKENQEIVIQQNKDEYSQIGTYRYVYSFTLKHSGTKNGAKPVYSTAVTVTVKK